MADNTIYVLLKAMKIVIYYQDIDVVLGASLTNSINSTSSLKSMSQITTYSLEPDMGLDKLKKDDIKKLTNIEFETDNKIEEITSHLLGFEKKSGIWKKGGGKHMSDKVVKLLKIIFHTGDTCKSEQYTPKEMLEELKKKHGNS
ncbi:7870_t:CDS:2 [Entrophospora sp. SA101]|nr:7870_t:CDS:2 [Entrophospora sp. SA101]